MTAQKTYHDNFSKSCGDFTVKSYGGGWPRGVEIEGRTGQSIRCAMNDIPDLQYLLERLRDEIELDKK